MIDKRRRVGVDVDSVLLDLLTPLFVFLNARYGTAYSQADMLAWDVESTIPEGDSDAFWDAFAADVRGHHALVPFPGAVEGMARLSEVCDVYIVTSYLHNSETWVHDRDAWLSRHFGVSRKRIVHTHAKYVFSGAALIDDKPQNIEEWIAEQPQGFGILWSQPYNLDIPLVRHPRVVRTDNWDAVVRLFTTGTRPPPPLLKA